MKRARNFLQVGAGLALLAAFTLVLVVVFRAMSGGGAPGALQATPLPQGYPPPQGTLANPEASTTQVQGYPPPQATLLPSGTTYPTPVVDELQPPQTPTPWLTFTPPPQPTRQPGPTETPLPLPHPAQDAAGFITYLSSSKGDAWGGANTLALYSLPVDKTGLLQNAPRRLTGDAELNLQWGVAHPSPDGSRLAIEGAWGAVTILNTETGQLEPLARQGTGGAGGFLGWHPDNRRVLYRGDGDFDAGLWLVGDKQFTVLVIEPTVGAIRDAAASPDGQKVIYSFWRGFGSAAELRMINVDGSDSHVLYTTRSDVADIYFTSWSPDGSKIAFAGDQGYTVMDADGANPRPLAIKGFTDNNPAEPVWSPDSRSIAYVTSDGTVRQKGEPLDPFRGATIRLIDVVTGEDRSLLMDDSTGNIDPAWSPDGSQIVFASTRSGTPEIWVVNVDRTNLRQLTNSGQFVRFPTWRRALNSQQP